MARVLVNTVSLSGGALTRERRILEELPADTGNVYDVLATPATVRALGSLPEQVRCHEVSAPGSTPGRVAWENTRLLGQVRRRRPDVLYFPLHLTNLLDLVPKVAAVRNAAPFYPAAHQGAPRSERLRLRALEAGTRRTVRQAERVLFMSRATMETVAESVPAAAEKGVVVPHGRPAGFEPVEPDGTVLARHDLPDRFVLSVSNVARYKNLVELVEGYALAAGRCALPPLCLAGKVVDEGYHEELRARVRALDLEDDVRLLGFVDRADLPHLHAASEFFAFSSACENAPLSLLEALCCGSPVASSEAAAMPELCGDAAVYFDPYRPGEVADALERLATDADLRAELSAAALEHAATFDWERTAARVDEVLRSFGPEGVA